MINIERREQIGQVLNQMGLLGEAVEVGAAWGGFSREALWHWKGKSYHLIDVWEPQRKEIYHEENLLGFTMDQVDFGDWHQRCVELALKDSRVHLFKGYSLDAAKMFAPESLDWVYIDANHAPAAIAADLEAWWPKVKPGGVFSGHDYGRVMDTLHPFLSSVGRKHRNTSCDSWWVLK